MTIRKSLWSEALKIFICAILFWLIVPLVILIITVMTVRRDIFEIRDDRIIHTFGLFSKNEQIILFKNVLDCRVSVPFWGRICKYGDISLSIIGGKRVAIPYAKDPEEVQALLRKYIEKARTTDMAQVLAN